MPERASVWFKSDDHGLADRVEELDIERLADGRLKDIVHLGHLWGFSHTWREVDSRRGTHEDWLVFVDRGPAK